MQIKVNDLRDFFKRSNKIKSNGVLPIHDYILFQIGLETIALTKSNGNMYVKHTISQENEEATDLIIEEKRLLAVVNTAKGEYITITNKSGSLILDNGDNKAKLEAPSDLSVKSFKHFPEIEQTEKTVLSEEVISSLYEARLFAADYDSNFNYIYIIDSDGGGSFIYSSDRYNMYIRRFSDSLPAIGLSPEACSIIGAFKTLEYCTSGSYDFFDTGATIYGFLQTVYKCADFQPVLNFFKEDKSLTLSRSELVSFAEFILSSHRVQTRLPSVSFDDEDGQICLSYQEPEYSFSADKMIEAATSYQTSGFSLSASKIIDLLKCFTADRVTFTTYGAERMFKITSPDSESLIGITSALVPAITL